jgi:hypothetical protein
MAKARTSRKTAQKPPSRKIEDKEQYERFREFAREVEADDDPEAFDRALRRVVSHKPKPAIRGKE